MSVAVPPSAPVPTLTPVGRALLSVSDKTGLEAFARALHGHGVALVSTGGTARTLSEAGLPVTEVSDHTGFPEMMDGRVKTLHPASMAGCWAGVIREDDLDAMQEHGIPAIDLLVVNLYPFEETSWPVVPRPASRTIDIGGPAMIRAAAKNHAGMSCA